jgi:hypothetical protein
MKNFLCICIVIGCFHQGWAQSPSSDAAPAPVMASPKSLEWESADKSEFSNSVDYWKNLVKQNASNEEAWLNYYKCARALALLKDGAVPSKRAQEDLNELIGNMANAVPESFAFHYANYVNGNKSDESFNYLTKAIQLRPNESELYDDMLCNAVISENNAAIGAWSKRMSDERLFTSTELEYNRNVLNSVESQAVLITNGNVDTSPLYMLQSEGFRKDVIIVCLDWLGSNRYQNLLAGQLKLKPGVFKMNDRSGSFESLLNQLKNKPVYSALTVPSQYLNAHVDQLYCTGLALKYSTTPISNLPSLIFNWENLFSKKYWAVSEGITKNYLVPATVLLAYYDQNKEEAKAAELRQFIQKKKQIHVTPYQSK